MLYTLLLSLSLRVTRREGALNKVRIRLLARPFVGLFNCGGVADVRKSTLRFMFHSF